MRVKCTCILCPVRQFGTCRSLAHLKLPGQRNFRFCPSTTNPSAVSLVWSWWAEYPLTMAASSCAKSPFSEPHTLIRSSPSSVHEYLCKSVRYYFTDASALASYLLTCSMVQSPSWEANWFAASQEVPPHFYGTRRFITALASVRHLSLSWASPIQSTYPHPTSWRSILILILWSYRHWPVWTQTLQRSLVTVCITCCKIQKLCTVPAKFIGAFHSLNKQVYFLKWH